MVVIDIDGVLCDNSEALSHFARMNPDALGNESHEAWDKWYALLPDHPSSPGWVALCGALSLGQNVVLLTARPEALRKTTESWLDQEGVQYDRLVMWDPSTTAWSYCKEMFVISHRQEILLAVDDSEHHVLMYERYGIPCIRVTP